MTTFPNGRHDDQVDSTAQMLDWFKRGAGPSSNAGIFELYRQRAEELRRGETRPGRMVRLRAPAGVGAVQLLQGSPGRCQPTARRDVGVGRRAAIGGGVGKGGRPRLDQLAEAASTNPHFTVTLAKWRGPSLRGTNLARPVVLARRARSSGARRDANVRHHGVEPFGRVF